MVPDSRQKPRRSVYEESTSNSQQNTEILQDFFETHNPRTEEIPPLIVTCVPSNQSQTSSSSRLVARNRSKVQSLIDMHIEKRKERRDYFHRNCLPVDENKRTNNMRQARAVAPTVGDTGLIEVMDSVEELQEPEEDKVVLHEASEEQTQEIVPNDIKELEKLIEETHALLQAEGVVDINTIFPKRPFVNDREILEELEKDLERIVVDQQKENVSQPDSSLEQLEKELNDLIQQ